MLIVQKYGGTSMGGVERIQKVATRVNRHLKDKFGFRNKLVVVVSAMSGVTDEILGYAKDIAEIPNERDLDMALSSGEQISAALLSIALNASGTKAISLNGRQAKIITDSNHTRARIQHIDTSYIMELLEKEYVVVVTGFQGLSIEGEITTLGRGGSDLSAVALAGALNADLCEIYSDVDGIFTTDPRIESRARKIEKISYDEMLELASMGAKVLLNRSVELAKKWNVPLYAKSSFSEDLGTLITTEDKIMEKPVVSGIALEKNQARISVFGIKDKPGIAASLFGKLSYADVNVDMIVQTVGRDSKTNLDFTVPKNELHKVKENLEEFKDKSDGIEYDNDVAIVSIVGVGMKSHSGVAAKAFAAMADENINILMISTSEIKISMLIDIKYAELSVRILHSAYNLDKER